MPLLRCEHPGVVMKFEGIFDGKDPHQETGKRAWYQCAECGARAPFERFTAITAHQYNLKRGYEEKA